LSTHTRLPSRRWGARSAMILASTSERLPPPRMLRLAVPVQPIIELSLRRFFHCNLQFPPDLPGLSHDAHAALILIGFHPIPSLHRLIVQAMSARGRICDTLGERKEVRYHD